LRVLLICLPLPGPSGDIQKGNHQLFSDYIEALASVRNISGLEILRLPRKVTDSNHNRALADEIMKAAPDLVGFSCYVWNSKRSAAIASLLHERGIITVAGGPEVQADNTWLLAENGFTYFIQGEGEEVFLELCKKLADSQSKKTGAAASAIWTPKTIISGSPVDFNEYIETYSRITRGFLDDGFAYLETSRGCAFHCSYCSYGKNRGNIATISTPVLHKCLNHFFNREMDELYLLAPTLNSSREEFVNTMTMITDFQNPRVSYNIKPPLKIFGELRPELLREFHDTLSDFDMAEKAGFSEIEIGVQTLNPEIGSRIGRPVEHWLDSSGQPTKLLALTDKLLSRNIVPVIDFLLGLPGDTPKNLARLEKMLETTGLIEYSSFYHLMILPGTRLRETAAEKNIIFQPEPPYFVAKTPTLSFDDIQEFYLRLSATKSFDEWDGYFDLPQDRFFHIRTLADFSLIAASPWIATRALIEIDNTGLAPVLSFYREWLAGHAEVFHGIHLHSKKEIPLDFLDELNAVLVGHRNYYDLFREHFNTDGQTILSKTIEVIIPPDCSDTYLDKVLPFYGAGFSFFDATRENILRHGDRLMRYFTEDGVSGYVFKMPQDMFLPALREWPGK